LPDVEVCGEPEWNVTLLLKPEAWIVSAVSTVTVLFMPDTVRLAQWPVIVTVLVMPLTLTTLSSHAIVSFLPMPETVKVAPGGAVEVGPVVPGARVGAPGVPGVLVGTCVMPGRALGELPLG